MIDEILKIVDPELFNYLTMKNLKADFYSMPRMFFNLKIGNFKEFS